MISEFHILRSFTFQKLIFLWILKKSWNFKLSNCSECLSESYLPHFVTCLLCIHYKESLWTLSYVWLERIWKQQISQRFMSLKDDKKGGAKYNILWYVEVINHSRRRQIRIILFSHFRFPILRKFLIIWFILDLRLTEWTSWLYISLNWKHYLPSFFFESCCWIHILKIFEVTKIIPIL